MNRKPVSLGRPLLGAVLAAMLLTVLLAAIQFFAVKTPGFMGQNTESLVSSLKEFYPWAAVGAMTKLISVVWLYLTVLFYLFFLGLSFWRKRASTLPWLMGCGFAVSIAALGFANLLKYPALYDSFLSPGLRELLYKMSFWLKPLAFQAAAAAFLVALLAPGLVTLTVRIPKLIVIPVTFAVAVLVGFAKLHPGARTFDKPHVLMIGIDSLRNDRFENPKVMPNLNALRQDKQSLYFKDHYVGVPRTFPSWIEILQGRYAPQTGVRHMFPDLSQRNHEFKTIASVLRDAGYHTAAVSDFAGDIFPRFQGGFEEINAPKLTLSTMIRLGTYQMFPLFLPVITEWPARNFFADLKESPVYSDPEHLTEATLASFGDADKPLFLLSFYSTAHFPYAAPFPFYNQFTAEDYTGDYKFLKNPSLAAEEKGLSAADRKQVQGLYDGALASIDSSLGELFSQLKKNGLWDKTLIIITADHGEDLYDGLQLQGHGEHLRGQHVLRVPFLVKLPAGATVARKEVNFTTRSIDIADTVRSLVGVKGKVGEGVDLSPWIKDSQLAAPQNPAYSETGIWFSASGGGFFQEKRISYPGIAGLLVFDPGGSDDIVLKDEYNDLMVTSRHRSLMYGDYKLIYMPTATGIEYELYNHRLDPDNLENLMETEEGKAKEMINRLLAMIDQLETDNQVLDGYVLPRY